MAAACLGGGKLVPSGSRVGVANPRSMSSALCVSTPVRLFPPAERSLLSELYTCCVRLLEGAVKPSSSLKPIVAVVPDSELEVAARYWSSMGLALSSVGPGALDVGRPSWWGVRRGVAKDLDLGVDDENLERSGMSSGWNHSSMRSARFLEPICSSGELTQVLAVNPGGNSNGVRKLPLGGSGLRRRAVALSWKSGARCTTSTRESCQTWRL
mmetsp:Transcript_3987/g.9467  ORF Transcript_3987/g.9467 Transcript_3987/m.9467 type:complete len:212 (-) Transcript_3987:786-1421(-)